MKFLFEITNCDSHVAMYGPIINTLSEKYPGCKIQVLSLCEVLGIATNQQRAASIAQDFLQPYKVPFTWPGRISGLKGQISRVTSFLEFIERKRKVSVYIDKLLNSINPDVIILPNDRHTPHIPLIKAARKRRIPTVLIPESIRKDESFKQPIRKFLQLPIVRHFLGVGGSELLYHGQGGCDLIAAWGKTSLDYFTRIGVPREKVILAGNPRMETLAKRDWKTQGYELKKRYSIPENTSVIAFTTNPVDSMGILNAEQLVESVSMVVNAVTTLTDSYLFLKPHRFENINKYRQIISQNSQQSRIHIEADIDLYPLLSISDACLIFNSTVALEAAILGIPVAVINPFHVDMGIDFVKNGLCTEVATGEQLIGFLRSCRDGKHSVNESTIQKYLAIVHGSADRIATEIYNLAMI
jgi:hypothetical protein